MIQMQQSKLMLFGWLTIVLMFNGDSKSGEVLVLSLLEYNFSLMSVSIILFHYLKTKWIDYEQNETRGSSEVGDGKQNQVNVSPPLLSLFICFF